VAATVSALCQRARAAAQVVATGSDGGTSTAPVNEVIVQGLADAARLEAPDGSVKAQAGRIPLEETAAWKDCTAAGVKPGSTPAVVAAVVELHRADGTSLGRARAAFAVDAAVVNALSRSAGVDVTVLTGTAVAASTLADDRARAAAQAAVSDHKLSGTARNVLVLRVITPDVGQPLTIALSTSRAQSGGLYALLLVAVLAAGVLAIAVAWRLARATTLPLAEVARTAERVADGDLDARVPVRGRDEVGRLASTFNRMTREMQAYVTALTSSRDQLRGNLALLGDTLSSTHKLDRILEVILETVMAATGAQAGVVLLVERGENPWPGVLIGEAGNGLSGRGVAVEDMRLRIGEGVLGSVAASGESKRGRAGEKGAEFAASEPSCRTYIAVPFSGTGQAGSDEAGLPASGRLLGVLALYDRLGADDFDDGDLVTLRTFAGQAAVAVENVLLHQEAERLSLTDPLTGLWNYRYLQVSLHHEVERAVRFDRPLAVLTADLDRFKEVNDAHGHGAGDAVLAEVARRLRSAVREVDLVFRQGGEQFVILLPETDQAGAEIAADRICAVLRAEPIRLSSPDSESPDLVETITASVGAAIYPEHGVTGADVLEAADDALYAAKAAGRDTWRLADGMRRR
jgi:diguanylate cyclase (GGDEF)-like protein